MEAAELAGAAERLGGPGTAAKANLPTHSDYNGIASIIMFVFAALVAPEMLCRDKRDGVINLYLVRPMTGTDYIVSRWAAFLTVMTLAAWLPQVILFLGLCGGDLVPLEYFKAHWEAIPKFLLGGFAIPAPREVLLGVLLVLLSVLWLVGRNRLRRAAALRSAQASSVRQGVETIALRVRRQVAAVLLVVIALVAAGIP